MTADTSRQVRNSPEGEKKRKANKITSLTIDEVSLVDFGANPDAHIRLWKRSPPPSSAAEPDPAMPSPYHCPNCGGELFLAARGADGAESWQCNGDCLGTPAFTRHGNTFSPVTEKRAFTEGENTYADTRARMEMEDSLRRLGKFNYDDNAEDQMETYVETITKRLAADLKKGTIGVLQSDVSAVAKSRAGALYHARGCPPNKKHALLDEAWGTALDEWAPVSDENPTLRRLHDLAPATRAVSKRAVDLAGERRAIEVQLERAVEKVRQAHPDWSATKTLDAAYTANAGLYAKYVATGHELARLTKAA